MGAWPAASTFYMLGSIAARQLVVGGPTDSDFLVFLALILVVCVVLVVLLLLPFTARQLYDQAPNSP